MERIIPLAEGANLAAGRHPKWQKVPSGTVIPAGQPYRIEYGNGTAFEYGSGCLVEVTAVSHGRTEDWFIDSSWRPPLDLPTEPTWGVGFKVICDDEDRDIYHHFDQWHVEGKLFVSQHDTHRWWIENVHDFIPLTPEQVARIEAAR